ncbi:MAG: hypothetical protein OXI01_05120 [Albidovulum sp.]|nr:hypothetical protein [Albidovulum sp.]
MIRKTCPIKGLYTVVWARRACTRVVHHMLADQSKWYMIGKLARILFKNGNWENVRAKEVSPFEPAEISDVAKPNPGPSDVIAQPAGGDGILELGSSWLQQDVFDTRPVTDCNDDISCRYHVPNRYLPEAERIKKDWIVYRELRRGGSRKAYVAVAQVARIEPDPFNAGSPYAYISRYLEFDQVVPLHGGTQYCEAGLNSIRNPSRIGIALQGKSVRTISEDEFGAIALEGFA